MEPTIESLLSSVMEAAILIDTVERKYTILDKYWPIIEKELPKNESKLFRHIAAYRNDNLDKLETPYFTDYPVWKDKEDGNFIFTDILHVDPDDAEKDVDAIELPKEYNIKKYFVKAYHIFFLMFIRYYWMKKDQKRADMLYYYMAYSLYWMAYTRSFQKFNPPEELVVYTVNNLSNRFFLKQLGTINNMLKYGVTNSLEHYKKYLLDGFDYSYIYVIHNLRTRIGEYVNKLAEAVFANHEDRKVIWKGETTDNEGNERVASSKTANIIMLADEHTSSFFSNPPREDLIARVATVRRVDQNEIKNVITYLIDHNSFYEEVHTFYEVLFHLFFESPHASMGNIKSIFFVSEMEKQYKKGNTNNKNLLTMRKILNHWLEVASNLYMNAAKASLRSEYRKAIFYYFVFGISSNK